MCSPRKMKRTKAAGRDWNNSVPTFGGKDMLYWGKRKTGNLFRISCLIVRVIIKCFGIYVGTKSVSTVTCNSLARLNANTNVGSYLLFSIAFTVCLDTPHFFASSSCDSPSFFLLSRIVFSISTTILSFVIQKKQKIYCGSHTDLDKGIDIHCFSFDEIFYDTNHHRTNRA